ncbi:MAG: hypothetical protein Q8O84_02515 [Nanoarchaeota archaeon]|nr:hypothetical protein [Nanoarchaeota archaeon]MDP3758199.1 hypothetical protein [Candidatus Daviesbacteria bacterium]
MIKLKKNNEYSIISERDEKGNIKHSYAGEYATNDGESNQAWIPFKNFADSSVYIETHNEHKRLLTDFRMKISKIETKIIEEIK